MAKKTITLNRKKIEAQLKAGATKAQIIKKLGVGTATFYNFLLHSEEPEYKVTRRAGKKKTSAKPKAKAKAKPKAKAQPKAANGARNGVTKHYGDEVAVQQIRIHVFPERAAELKEVLKTFDVSPAQEAEAMDRLLESLIKRLTDPDYADAAAIEERLLDMGRRTYASIASA